MIYTYIRPFLLSYITNFENEFYKYLIYLVASYHTDRKVSKNTNCQVNTLGASGHQARLMKVRYVDTVLH